MDAQKGRRAAIVAGFLALGTVVVAALTLRKRAVEWWHARDGLSDERLSELMARRRVLRQELADLATRHPPTSDRVKSKVAELAAIEKEIQELK